MGRGKGTRHGDIMQKPSAASTLFGVRIDPVSMTTAVGQTIGWLRTPVRPCRYIVTPNVNHIVALERDSKLRSAYDSASMVVADGWPVVAAARLMGVGLPERVAGSDLVPAVFAASADLGKPLRVFLLGGMPGVAETAKERIEAKWENVQVVGVYSPAKGFESDPEERATMVERVNSHSPDFLVVGLGAPKQEVWLAENHCKLDARAAIAAGATIDFLAGVQTRAPRVVRWLGLEWCFRMVTDPGRLAKRYLRDAVLFPRLIAREYLARAAVKNSA